MTLREFMRPGLPMRVIAHRGCSGIAPENTMAAFRKAIRAGAAMIELDVLLSKHGEVVVIHDATLDRTTSGKGNVADFTLAELKQLDAGSWFDPEFTGETIPTLGEVLSLVKGHSLLNVEIKSEAVTDDANHGIERLILDLVVAAGMLDQVLISSFEPRAVTRAKSLEPSVMTAMLYNAELQSGMEVAEIIRATGCDGFNLSREEVTPEIVRACHTLGCPVMVYTVDDANEAFRLSAMGVDAIFTNHPESTMRALIKRNESGL